jgi:two-component system response regulator AlgR
MTMRVLIADDEAPARARLRRMVEELPGYEVVGEAANGRDTLDACVAHAPNVVLLDIRMPDMDGIEAARHIAGLGDGPAVVFTTAYDYYAIDAFDAHAVGYLLKPVRRERLETALAFAARLGGSELAELSRAAERPVARENICVRRGANLHLIPADRILYFHADQKYVTVRHTDGEDLLDEPLKDLAKEFADLFIRIHRSTLIALRVLDRMERRDDGQYEVRLRGVDDPLLVSRRHVTAVKSCLKRLK